MSIYVQLRVDKADGTDETVRVQRSVKILERTQYLKNIQPITAYNGETTHTWLTFSNWALPVMYKMYRVSASTSFVTQPAAVAGETINGFFTLLSPIRTG